MKPVRTIALILLMLTVFAIPWQDAIVLPGFGTVAKGLGILTLLFTLASLAENGALRLRPPSLVLVVTGLFVLWLMFSYYWSIDPQGSRSAVMQYLQLLAFVWVVWEICRSPAHLQAVAQAFVVGAYVSAINILYIFLFVSHEIRIDGRITSAGANQNDAATMLAISLAFAWWLITKRRSFVLYVINVLFLPIGVAAILLTGSRGGTLEATLALAAIPLTLTQLGTARRVLLLLFIAGLAVGVTQLPATYLQRATPDLQRVSGTANDLADQNLSGRLGIWKGGMQALQARPVVGYGVEAFRAAVTPILGNGWAPHNTFLSIAVGTGLIGLALFALILLVAALPLFGVGSEGGVKVATLFVFLTLAVGLLPLGWEYNKVTWLVIAFVSAAHGHAVWPAGHRFGLRARYRPVPPARPGPDP